MTNFICPFCQKEHDTHLFQCKNHDKFVLIEHSSKIWIADNGIEILSNFIDNNTYIFKYDKAPPEIDGNYKLDCKLDCKLDYRHKNYIYLTPFCTYQPIIINNIFPINPDNFQYYVTKFKNLLAFL